MSNRTATQIIAQHDEFDTAERGLAALDAEYGPLSDEPAPGQTFRQRGGRLLHIYSGEVTRTQYSYGENDTPDTGPTVPLKVTYGAAACGSSYEPVKGDRVEVSDRKVCAKCQRATA